MQPGLAPRNCLALARAVRRQVSLGRPAGPIDCVTVCWWWSKARMPPRKKKAPAKADADYLDDDDDDENFVDDHDSDDDAPSKKRKAPKKATPGKPKPIETPHIALEGPKWTLVPPHLMYREAGPKSGKKIAGFDFDGTLVQNKSTSTFAIGADDWKLYNAKVPSVLKQYHEDGYKVVVFSNQGSIGKQLDGKMSHKLRVRAEQVFAQIDVPATIMYATGKDGKDGNADPHRKPQTGMWDHFVKYLNGGIVPDKAQSFFVGDMAGREGDPGKNPGSDREFAESIGIGFKTPEEVFGQRNTGAGGGPAPTGPNAGLIAAFEQLAEAGEQAGDNMFKVRAFRTSARIIAEQTEKIASAAQLKGVKGIGKGSMAVITEFLDTGKLAALEAVGGVRKPGEPAPAVKPTADAAMAMKFI